MSEIEELFEYLKQFNVDGHQIAPAYGYSAVNDREIFMTRDDIHEKFKDIDRLAQEVRRSADARSTWNSCKGERELPCTAWGNPTYNVKGWKGPCYLITDGHYKTFEELMTKTPWESYGAGNDPRCEHCMVHCGFEPSAALGINAGFADNLKMLSMDAALGGTGDSPVGSGQRPDRSSRSLALPRTASRAGPRPMLWRSHDPGRDGILLNIVDGSGELVAFAEVVIVGFVLPKLFPCPAQNSVCRSGRRTFEPSHENRSRGQRQHQNMHMIGHNHPGIKLVKLSLIVSPQDSVGHHIGNPRIAQPPRAGGEQGQFAVLRGEPLPGGSIQNIGLPPWYRPPQAPGQKEIALVGVKMRQFPPIFPHIHRWANASTVLKKANAGQWPALP